VPTTPTELFASAPQAVPEDGARLCALLQRAAAELLARFDPLEPVPYATKGDGSPVTEADLAANRVILEGLRAGWPGVAIVSEEAEIQPPDPGTPWWCVDPLDGTSAFLEGLAHWGPTVARISGEGRVEEGATLLPRTGEIWYLRGREAWHQGRPMRRPLHAPRVALVSSKLHRSGRLNWNGKARCLGGTAAHLALVARGSAAAVIVGRGWAPWDVAVGTALIEATGGAIRRVSDGGALDLRRPGEAFVAGEAGAVEALLAETRWLGAGGQDGT
jgi:fructose-1,6-bisphosphatase/inositol monophosphatase family enzyme